MAKRKSEVAPISASRYENLRFALIDLPLMLKSHRGKWVAYGDGRQLRYANSQSELYRYCLKELGLTHDRFVVRRIETDVDLQVEGTPR